MIIKSGNYWIISRNSNTDYWGQDVSPPWTAVGSFIYHPSQVKGAGVEPHYHDGDEIWIFRCGSGEAWIDGQSHEVTPNTVVYTPMGAVHRFQMFTDFDNASVVTRLERQERGDHLLVEADGPPVPTVPGFVVAGSDNSGPLPTRGPRCPFSELRTVQLEPGEELQRSRLPANEHWVVASGALGLTVDGLEVELSSGDVALMRAGAVRAITCTEHAEVFLARE